MPIVFHQGRHVWVPATVRDEALGAGLVRVDGAVKVDETEPTLAASASEPGFMSPEHFAKVEELEEATGTAPIVVSGGAISITPATADDPGSMSAAHFAKLDALAPLADLPTVIMLNGQSNMAAGPAVAFGFSELTPLLGPDILGFGHTAGAMVQVVDGSCHARANHGGGGTGPGPGLGQVGTRLCRYIADVTGSTVRTYAAAFSGQGISYFRKLSATMAYFEDGTQHGSLNNYNLIKSYVTATGIIPQLYVWIQGEADAGSAPGDYYTQINGHWTDLQADYPGINMLIVGTIQGRSLIADDRGGVGAGGTVAGVRRAQKRLAEENPGRVYYVDTTDMRPWTAWWFNNHYGTYDTTSVAHEEVALRIFAKLRGEADRPNVVGARHPLDVFAFDHAYSHRRSINAGPGTLALWQDNIGTDSLTVEAGSPDHVPSDANFGNRATISFDPATSDRLTETSIAGGNKWVFYFVALLRKSAFNVTPRCVVQVEPAAAGNRIGFLFSSSGEHQLFLEGPGVVPFTGIASCEGDMAHSYCVTYDGDAGTAKLYIDGLPVSSLTGLANVTTGATARIRVGSLSGGLFFAGEMAFLAVKAMPAAMPTDAEVLAMHGGSRVEYALET